MGEAISEAVVLLTVVFILVLGLDHVDQLVIWLDRVLHVEILSRCMLLLQNRLDQVFEHGPAILHVYVELAGKGFRLHADEADDIMGLVR